MTKIPKLQPQVEQEVRHRLASARSKFQDLTRGIYPESGPEAVPVIDQDPSQTKEEAPPLSATGSGSISGSPDSSAPPPGPAGAFEPEGS